VCVSCIGLDLLACCARTSGAHPSSFYTVTKAALPRWSITVDLVIALDCFGTAISYLLIVGDLLPMAVRHIQGGAGKA
jgi:amino acid permease